MSPEHPILSHRSQRRKFETWRTVIFAQPKGENMTIVCSLLAVCHDKKSSTLIRFGDFCSNFMLCGKPALPSSSSMDVSVFLRNTHRKQRLVVETVADLNVERFSVGTRVVPSRLRKFVHLLLMCFIACPFRHRLIKSQNALWREFETKLCETANQPAAGH